VAGQEAVGLGEEKGDYVDGAVELLNDGVIESRKRRIGDAQID
jgi:hypothetical protein